MPDLAFLLAEKPLRAEECLPRQILAIARSTAWSSVSKTCWANESHEGGVSVSAVQTKKLRVTEAR